MQRHPQGQHRDDEPGRHGEQPQPGEFPEVGRRPGNPRRALLEVNNAQAVVLAIRSGLGIGAVSDFLTHEVQDLVRVLPDLKSPKVDVFFVYPEELRNSKRVAVFRDFLLARLAEMH